MSSRSSENNGVKPRKSQKLQAEFLAAVATVMSTMMLGTMTNDTLILTQFTTDHIRPITPVYRPQYLYPIPVQQIVTQCLSMIYGTLSMTATMVSLITGLWPPVSGTVVTYPHLGTADPIFPPGLTSTSNIFRLRFPINLHTILNYLN